MYSIHPAQIGHDDKIERGKIDLALVFFGTSVY